MSTTMEKHIYTSYNELITFLQSNNKFSITNNQMRWSYANQNSLCYFGLDPNQGKICFINSLGNNAFGIDKMLVDFTSGYGAVIFIPLADNGCILYLTTVPTDFSIDNLTLSCDNHYSYEGYDQDLDIETWTANSNTLENGVVVCTPAESDGYWRYSWRDAASVQAFNWCIDDCHSKVTTGIELPSKLILPGDMYVGLSKVYLESGTWSNHIYQQVLGELNIPSMIFKVNGQKYISITDNTGHRAPVFRLAPEFEGMNISTSTEGYSPLKTYKIGDYCIYNDLLWRCVRDISTPTPFDQLDWVTTTVSMEIMR